MFKSIQWKLVLIYSLLILFAMQFFAVFLSQSLEDYYVNTYSKNLESQGLLLVNFLERYFDDSDGEDANNAIDDLVLEYSRYAGTTDIMVLDAFGRVISSSRQENQLRGQRIMQEEITRALMGNSSEAIRLDPETRERMKYLALPVFSGERQQGVVYVIGSLEPIYSTLREIQLIFLTGALMVIGITILLGFFLAKSITGPIQEVTSKAAQIAHGDFRQRITTHSEDEIGRLGDMFNYLSQQLDATLQEISSEKGKVEAILNHMTDGIVALARDGQVLHVNPKARRLLGLSAGEELSMDSLTQLVSQIDVAQLLKTGQQDSHEVVIAAPQQQIIHANYVPFHTQDVAEPDYFSGILIVLHDVTQERELIRIQQEFVANVSHELRTPLTTLKSYTETLLDGAMLQPDTCLSFLTTMEKETERMVRLVRDLLSLSQLDYRQVGWHKENHYLDDVIKEVVNELKIKNKTDTRRVTVSLPVFPVTVYVDRDKIKQVLLNIMQNAHKFTEVDGHIAILLDQTDSDAIIQVIDDGMGIPAEDVERVFERFYRVDKTRSREYGGTGLGLSIAREIIAAHGGTISLVSEQDFGTTVTITVPLVVLKEDGGTCASA
ncbi:MAG: cell wall metabolism sensor histidine kinase WalK [Firmicutes bacterium]|nr:cell wall metabolism sensor histidine kinase WalK [Bacillota bacterium]